MAIKITKFGSPTKFGNPTKFGRYVTDDTFPSVAVDDIDQILLENGRFFSIKVITETVDTLGSV